MDEIRGVNQNEKNEYSLRIYSERLLNLKKQCSEDGAWSHATGEMYYIESISRWAVEYLCPIDGEIFRSWARETEAITKEIAKDVLEKNG